MAVPGDAAGYRLAYEAGLQAVAEQAATLRETRDRAGTLMSAAAVAGGLAAGLAFSSDRVRGIDGAGTVGGFVAVVGFVGVVVTTLMIWRPTEGRFVHDAGVIVGSYLESGWPVGDQQPQAQPAPAPPQPSRPDPSVSEKRGTTEPRPR